MIDNKNFHSNLLKIDKMSYEKIDIYYIGYVTTKDSDYVKIYSVNPLYVTIGEKNGYKYLTLASTDKNKEVMERYRELWDGVK